MATNKQGYPTADGDYPPQGNPQHVGDQCGHVLRHDDVWSNHETTSFRHPVTEVAELRASPLNHCCLIAVETRRAPVRFVKRRAGKPVKVDNALKTRNSLMFWFQLGWVMT